MNKRALVVGNWKMELSHKSSLEVFLAIKKLLQEKTLHTEVVVCPSFPSLAAIAQDAKGSSLAVGAQNVAGSERGAYTGRVSVAQLREFVSWCIVGHSEVRSQEGDTDADVVTKIKLLLAHGILPIVCIGETAAQHDTGETISHISKQISTLTTSLDRVSLMKTVIAYEPIWAIGSGVTPDANEVYEVLLLIRRTIAEAYDTELSQRVRLLYGGSVQEGNVHEYISGPGADGVLVGGASIHPRDFMNIIMRVEESYDR